jgi:hypothetical protein
MVLRRESVRSRHLVTARSSGLRQQKRGSCGLKLGAKVNYSRAASYFQSIRAWAAPSIPFSTVKSMTNWLRYPIPNGSIRHADGRKSIPSPREGRWPQMPIAIAQKARDQGCGWGVLSKSLNSRGRDRGIDWRSRPPDLCETVPDPWSWDPWLHEGSGALGTKGERPPGPRMSHRGGLAC